MKNGYQIFIITQNAILKNKNGEILALRHKKSGKWLLPGGKINTGESWGTALKREIKEETGLLKFKIKEVIDIDSYSEPGKWHYVVTFLCSIKSENIRLSEEHDRFAWIDSVKELKKYQFWHKNINKRIAKVLKLQQ